MEYYSKSDYLAHYGILGMKWGVRRYQNADGSLTAEGRNRYGYIDKTRFTNGADDILAPVENPGKESPYKTNAKRAVAYYGGKASAVQAVKADTKAAQTKNTQRVQRRAIGSMIAGVTSTTLGPVLGAALVGAGLAAPGLAMMAVTSTVSLPVSVAYNFTTSQHATDANRILEQNKDRLVGAIMDTDDVDGKRTRVSIDSVV